MTRRKLVAIGIGMIIVIILTSVVWSTLSERSIPVVQSNYISESEFLSDAYFGELNGLFELVKNNNRRWYMMDSSNKIAAKAVINKMMDDLGNSACENRYATYDGRDELKEGRLDAKQY